MRLYTGSYSQVDFTLSQPDELGPIVSKWEDGLRTTGKRGELEWWYFDTKFDDGALFVCYFWKVHPLKDIYFIGMNYNAPDGKDLFLMKFFLTYRNLIYLLILIKFFFLFPIILFYLLIFY